MGVTTGELQANEYQIVTITIPQAPADADSTKLAQELQDIIDAFNATHSAKSVEVL